MGDSGGGQRLDVMPSRMVLAQMKERLSAAQTGHSLLQRKSDAIKIALRAILKDIYRVKQEVIKRLQGAAYAQNNAVWAAGEFNSSVIENSSQATYRVTASVTNITGVKIPKFRKRTDLSDSPGVSKLGLSRGGEAVKQCADAWKMTLDELVELASLQTSLKTLDEALTVTNRRVNALEFVVVPKIQNTITYIKSELDELEREDQFRIKKVKDLRMRNEGGDKYTNMTQQDDQDFEEEASALDEYAEDEDDVTDLFD